MEKTYFVFDDHVLDFEISKCLSEFELWYIGFEGPTTVCFCNIMSCVITHYCRFGDTTKWSSGTIFSVQDGDSMFFRNVGTVA